MKKQFLVGTKSIIFDANEILNVTAYFDGACEPKNPGGCMGAGACAFINNITVLEQSEYLPADSDNSNNVAEYMAFELLLDFIIKYELYKHKVHIYGDSKLVINQMKPYRPWKMHRGYYLPIANRCLIKLKNLLGNRSNISLTWISRDKNFHADRLSKAELIKNNIDFKMQPNEYR